MEDLVISLADVIASIYLELMSVDGDMSTEVVSSSLALCSLSTRELQKLRNEVIIVGCTVLFLTLLFYSSSSLTYCFSCSNVI